MLHREAPDLLRPSCCGWREPSAYRGPDHRSMTAEPGAAFRRPAPDRGLFHSRDAEAVGVSERDLRHHRYVSVLRGVRVPGDAEVDTWLRAKAALLVAGPLAVVSHHTAARLWGAAVPDTPTTHVMVATANERHRLEGTTFHVCTTLERGHRVRGVAVTSPEQTFIDLARVLPLVDAVVVGDCLVRLGHVTVEGLREACRRTSLKGAAAARHAAEYVRAGAESPMETRVRMLLVLAGLPEPLLQVEIRDDDGATIYRLDLAYPELRLALEYDGRQHAEDDAQWSRDLDRREYLDAQGWRLIILRAADIYTHPARALRRVVEALESREVRVKHLDPQWQRHFPGRTS